jgi:hypothetical protein
MHERGVPIWERDAHASADDGPLSGLEIDVRGSEQVTARITGMGALWQRQIRIELHDQDLDGSGLCASARHVTILRAVGPAGRGHRHGYLSGGPFRKAGQA